MSDTAPQTILAVTGEDDRFAAVRSRASAMAAGNQATVILYDLDAAGTFSSPTPTEWSGEGQQELTPDRMGPDELEAQGRKPLADHVRGMRQMGVDAWAWLPSSKDGKDLAAYAERQGADVILVPPELDGSAQDETRIPVVTIG